MIRIEFIEIPFKYSKSFRVNYPDYRKMKRWPVKECFKSNPFIMDKKLSKEARKKGFMQWYKICPELDSSDG